MSKIKKISLKPAKCALDLGDGSERGLYVNQDYILRKLGRPHRAINLMYCYYPFDELWPQRVSEAYRDKDISFAWDYPYDDYFPYLGGLNGSREGEPFTFMRDVRRHGQDIVLTLTCDPNITEEHMIAIAKDLATFGRLMLRINHEATGDWFSFTKRTTYQGVADFFVKFSNIIKEYAPNVKTVLCIGAIEADGRIDKEKEFTQAIKTADVWSFDQYLSLNWGWPYEVALKTNNKHKRSTPKEIYDISKASYDRFNEVSGGQNKPMLISEFNADGDVTGPYEQVKDVLEFCRMLKEDENHQWLSGFTMYQFRDDGRLGLEITDPNNSQVGIEQPLLKEYKKIIHDDFFKPGIEQKEEIKLPVRLRWGGSEDSDGVSVELEFEKNPVFAEAYFEEELEKANLMMEINGMWFYKGEGVKFVDFMPAFFEKGIQDNTKLTLNIFAPPATGENEPGETDYFYELKSLPRIRIEYETVM